MTLTLKKECNGVMFFFQAAFDKTVRKFSGEGGETNGGEGGQQVWPLTQIFLFPFLKKNQ